MLKELSDLGKRNREQKLGEGKIIHNALKDEVISIDLIINEKGDFVQFDVLDKITRPAEALSAKKGKARLLLDKAEEVLNFVSEDASEKEKKGSEYKHSLFMEKLHEYEELKELESVFLFYNENKKKGLDTAKKSFYEIPEKQRNGNIAFRIQGKSIRLHEERTVYDSIISKFEKEQAALLKNSDRICSVCGKSNYPIEDVPHGMIKKVPDGQATGCALVSYNESVFLSYGLKGNLNSSVCSNCATTYVEGLNWLLGNGKIQTTDKGKEYFKYSNRKNFGKDTAMVFWLKDGNDVAELDLLEEPNEAEIKELIDSIFTGKSQASNINTNYFYSFTLSGAAARIFIRDWIEQSLTDLKKSIASWFEQIRIMQFDYTQQKMLPYYASLYSLANATQNSKESKDISASRTSVYLWKKALSQAAVPIWVLNAVLKRIRVDEKGITPERVALIRLILNQNSSKGGFTVKEELDHENVSTAYVCGRIFCVLENLQRAALGKNINAGIRERFFSSASMTPSSAFGRLLKMAQNHLTKLKNEKPGLAVVLDKELGELISKINSFPVMFNLEDQGRFAIGYYHQKQESFRKASENKELREAVEE